MITLKKDVAIAIILSFTLVSYGQERNFSPWIIIKDKPLLDYVEPIIATGAGDHISLFASPENFEKSE